jgi:hypothetical protein
MIVGILIFYTIPFLIPANGNVRQRFHAKIVVSCISIAIGFFVVSAMLVIVLNIPGCTIPIPIPEWITVFGFIAILVAIFSITKILQVVRDLTERLIEVPFGPPMAADTNNANSGHRPPSRWSWFKAKGNPDRHG